MVELHDGGALFHAHMLAHSSQWTTLFEGGGGDGGRVSSNSNSNASVAGARTRSDAPREIVRARGGAALSVSLQYAPDEAARLVDMARGTLVAAMSTFVGARPNYGDGATYWSVAQADRGALPLESYVTSMTHRHGIDDSSTSVFASSGTLVHRPP